MKLLELALFTTLASCSAVAPAAQRNSSDREHRVTAYLGQRNLEEDDWPDVDEQPTIGVEYANERAGSPIGFEVGLMASGDEDDDVEASTGELYGGIRKTFGHDVVRPYIGGGLSFITAAVDNDVDDDDDSSVGAYVHGGVGFQVSDLITLGLDLRFLFGSDVEIFDVDREIGYGQFSLFIGFNF